MKSNQQIRGVLEIRNKPMSETHLLLATRSLSATYQNNSVIKPALNQQALKREQLNHLALEVMNHENFYAETSKGSSKGFSPKQYDVNRRLIEEVWQYMQAWAERTFGKRILRCKVAIKDNLIVPDAAGLFRYDQSGYCEIEIRRNCLQDTNYLLVVLAHEYIHYIHFSLVDYLSFYHCPKILCEGLAEVGARIFYDTSSYKLPFSMRKSWNQSYELGRQIVNQIISAEKFALDGFLFVFLMNVHSGNPWKNLDCLFD